MKSVLSALALFAVFSFMTMAGYSGTLEQVSNKELLKDKHNYIVLDTRSKQEFDAGHIEGAINIPHDQIANHIEQLLGYKKPIVVHCRSGRRAWVAEQEMLAKGITNIKHLEGDMNGWLADDLPVIANK